jgi:flagellar biosynthetic protein FliR
MTLQALLQHLGENQVAGFILVLGRIGPLFVLAPLFSSRAITNRAKGVCAVALAAGIAPIALGGHEVPVAVGSLVELMLKEVLVGLAYAFALAALFAAVSTAGSFLDTLIGFSYGALVDPVTGNQSAVLTQAYILVGILVLIAIGGDQLIIKGVARSYDLVPLLDMPSLPALVSGVQSAFVQVFLSALELAAPVVLAIVITDAAFGVVSRVVPQLNVFAVGFSLPFTAGWMADELQRSVATALQSIRMA